MITAKIFGGLGNQMFQYAAGRALASKYNVPLVLDINSYDKNNNRVYGLGCFKISAYLKSKENTSQFMRTSLINRILRRITIKKNNKLYREKFFNYDSEFKRLPNNTVLEGYWQSEFYFKDIEQQIRRDFTIIQPALGANLDWLARIKNTLSVSLHVRRGDYVSNHNANKVHGTCELDYYKKSLQFISEKIENDIELFIFSDDSNWVRNNLDLDNYKHNFVDNNNSINCHEDLRLMAACKHHIIANSTFSWWGAWLNSSCEKIVIAPSRWFRDETINDSDLIPQEWIRL